jgi:hypothetical protein
LHEVSVVNPIFRHQLRLKVLRETFALGCLLLFSIEATIVDSLIHRLRLNVNRVFHAWEALVDDS